MSDIFKVIEPGPLTTVQDLGRHGYQQFGVPLSGALDQDACRAANLLVGNPEEAALLEMTFLGPKLEVPLPGCGGPDRGRYAHSSGRRAPGGVDLL